MFEIVPNYYNDFKCIAEKCRHTCCAGWEIDIDTESLEKYKADGIEHISFEGEPHFELRGESERCPYLREDNLCQLIIDHGEDYICQICTDHPRFRNFWSSATETGVGLCCEAAAKLILLSDEPMKLVRTDAGDMSEAYEVLEEDEKYLWNVRDELLKKAGENHDKMTARLEEYFVFRHIPNALYDGLLDERIAFIRKCVEEITSEWNKVNSVEEKLEIARAYSEDVEYDDDVFINDI